MFPRPYLELYRNLASDSHHHIVSDVLPEQPSVRGPHGTEEGAIK
jgi:hypothetical protein